MTLRRFATIYVGCVALASMMLMWAMFIEMASRGEWYFTLRVDDFGEAWPELLMLSLAMALLPWVLYGLTET